jgi:hypothetical protein
VDRIPLTRTVMFSADYFTLLTTVVLVEDLRLEGESDDDLAVRLASAWLLEHYGFDVAGASNAAGVLED